MLSWLSNNRARVLAYVAIAMFAFAIIDSMTLAFRTSLVPRDADWQRAADFVRGEMLPRDIIVAAPNWADPLLRRELGGNITFEMAGHSDVAAFDRLWALSIRGALPAEAPQKKPDFSQTFGGVKVLRWDLGKSSVAADLVSRIDRATAEVMRKGEAVACRFVQFPSASGGGLGGGAMAPAQRFECPFGANWIAATINEDLSLAPRYCIEQRPTGQEPVRVTFHDVPLAKRLVFYGGLYSEDERMEEHAPVQVAVRINGQLAGNMQHNDGDGWKRMEIATPGGTGDVSVEVTSANPDKRSFCWAATTRDTAHEVGE